jgi:hypothetical protein
MDASRIHCPYTECVRTFNRQKDASRHARNHDMKEGRLNAYVCEVCNAFFVRIDELNVHQQKIHKFSKAVKKSSSNTPLIAILYRGSYKTIYFDGCISKKKTVVIVEALKPVGTYQAVLKCYKSKVWNGMMSWTSVEVGSKFTVTSLRENCTSCALFFNSALALKEHTKTTEHMERWDIINPSTIASFGGGKCAPKEEPSVDVLKRWFDTEMNDSVEILEVSDDEMNESFDTSFEEIGSHFNKTYEVIDVSDDEMNESFNSFEENDIPFHLSVEARIMNHGPYELRFNK